MMQEVDVKIKDLTPPNYLTLPLTGALLLRFRVDRVVGRNL
jgi:hypothetical protein